MSNNPTYRLLKTCLGILIILLCLTSYVLQFFRALSYENPWSAALMIITFFTVHTSIFIAISTILLLQNKTSIHRNRFHFITAIDVIITCLVFLFLLFPFMTETIFLQILLHLIIPPLYLILYFISNPLLLTQKNILFSLLHPLIYFLFVHVIVHPLYGEKLHIMAPDTFDPYVYPFLNPNYFNHGLLGMLMINFLVLFPLALAISYILFLIKKKIDVALDI